MKKTTQEVSAKKTAARLLIALGLLLPLAARAEIRKGSAEVGVFAGFNKFEDRQNLKDCPILGARLGYNLTRRWGLEGSVSTLSSRVGDKSVTGAIKGEFRAPMDKVKLTYYQVDVLFHFMPERRLNPFLVAGFGGTHYSPAISNGAMSTFDFGLGAKYWLCRHVALRMDLKDRAVGEVFKYSFQALNLTGGIVFSFGGGAKDKKAPLAKAQPTPVATAKPTPVVIVVADEPKVVEKVKAVAQPKVEAEVVLAFEDVHFSLESSSLTPNAKAILKRSVKILKENPNAKIRIAGYTSASGTEEFNQGLSERRAKAVRDYLVQEKVVDPARLTMIGYGENRPAIREVAPEKIYSKAAKANMRVLFVVLVQ